MIKKLLNKVTTMNLHKILLTKKITSHAKRNHHDTKVSQRQQEAIHQITGIETGLHYQWTTMITTDNIHQGYNSTPHLHLQCTLITIHHNQVPLITHITQLTPLEGTGTLDIMSTLLVRAENLLLKFVSPTPITMIEKWIILKTINMWTIVLKVEQPTGTSSVNKWKRNE